MVQLSRYVHVAGQVYTPGAVPPPDAADQITNPKAWAAGAGPRSVPMPEPPDEEDERQDDGAAPEPTRPTKSAPVDDWRGYVLAMVDIGEDEVAGMTKADLVALADEVAE